jgi:hypothetical protein
MKKILTLILTAVLCLSLGAQNEALRLITENPYRASNNMHYYEFFPIDDTPAPKGYKPFYISHYGRHGSRYEGSSTFARAAQEGFFHLDSLGLLTPAGKSLYAQVERIVEAHVGMEGTLTPRGAREHKQLAQRMAARFPEVFKNKERQEINSFSSTVGRCIVSMCNFTNSLTVLYPKLDFSYTSAERFMEYINPSLNIRRPGEPERPPMDMAAYRARQQAGPRAYQPAAGTPGYDFSRFLRPLFTDYDAALKELGNPEPFVRAIFSAGGLPQLIDDLGDIDIFNQYFTPEELVYLWAGGNNSLYRMWAGSAENGDVIRYAIRPLLMDFIEKADAALKPGSHRAADLRFGHDTSVLPLAALLNVDDTQHRVFPYQEASQRGWYAFFQVPMATNCQMIFYRNKKDDVLVKVLYNEKEVTFPGLEPVSGPYYEWTALRAHFIALCDKAAEPWRRPLPPPPAPGPAPVRPFLP